MESIWIIITTIATVLLLIVAVDDKIPVRIEPRIIGPLLVGSIFAIITYHLWPPSQPIISSNVGIDDYAFPPWIDHEKLDNPALDKSIKWEYHIDCAGNRLCWATLNLELNKEHDISDYKGISFSIKAKEPITATSENAPTLEFDMLTNKDRVYKYWTGKNNENMTVSKEWDKKEIFFSDLNIAHWAKDSEASSEPNLTRVYKLGFTAATPTQRSNTIWIHDITLIHKDEDGMDISIATGKVPILSPEDPLHGQWITNTDFKSRKDKDV